MANKYGTAEVSRTVGTGSYILSGALGDTFTFNATLNTGDTAIYKAYDGVNIEYGSGTFTAPNILSRDTIIRSSHSGNKISWPSSGQRFIELIINLDATLPEGGSTGDVLIKNSINDFDAVWAAPPWYIDFSVGGKISDLVSDNWDSNYEIFNLQAPVDLSFPVNFNGSSAGVKIAPVVQVIFKFQKFTPPIFDTPSIVGQLIFEAGSKEGIFSSGYLSLLSGSHLRLCAPSGIDLTISGLYGVIVGNR